MSTRVDHICTVTENHFYDEVVLLDPRICDKRMVESDMNLILIDRYGL